MDKKTFISELRQALSVLQEEELNDIINEYEQHIDMKIKNGLTEEEAIADFGSLSELTADILEAYHVRADYAAGSKKEKNPVFGEANSAGREILQQTKRSCKAAGEKTACGLKKLGAWFLSILLWGKQLLRKPVLWGKNQGKRWRDRRREKRESTAYIPESCAVETSAKEAGPERLPRLSGRTRIPSHDRRLQRMVSNTGKGAAAMAGGIGRFIARCFRAGMKFVAWGMRVAWNTVCIGSALVCAVFGLIFLYMFGLLAVLWMQHYPLAGVTIGCLGLVICAFSAAGFIMTLLWRKRRGMSGHGKTESGGVRHDDVEQGRTEPERVREMAGGLHA